MSILDRFKTPNDPAPPAPAAAPFDQQVTDIARQTARQKQIRVDRDALAQQLLKDEGVRANPYLDTRGKMTIGVGRNLDAKGFSPAEIEVLFRNDIERAKEVAKRGLTAREVALLFENDLEDAIADAKKISAFDRLDSVRQEALVNMAFQMGGQGVRSFRNMIAALEKKDFEAAAKHALDSAWANQTPNRARRVANMLRTGRRPGEQDAE